MDQDLQYISETLQSFHDEDYRDDCLDDLNEICSLVGGNPSEERVSIVLEKCSQVTDDFKREILVISIFEVLAEEPVHPSWFVFLKVLIKDDALLWILLRVYRDAPEKLYFDLSQLR